MLQKLIDVWIKDKAQISIWAIVFAALSLIVASDLKNFSEKFVALVSSLILVKFIFILIVLLFGVLFSFIVVINGQRKGPGFSKYAHSPSEGCWLNPNDSNERICSVCKSEKKLTYLERLGDYWHCPIHKDAVGTGSGY